ncbi:hypothetical protein [Bradyrhizobium sp. AZCC 2289]|uniref:hypothetical protein n=1 Tax=Bradyrhizobium sp. AZCC 2289 TaxID=3117026 RepID=UPI002FF24F3F
MFQWLSSAKLLHVQHMSNIGSVDCDHESPTEITLGEVRSSGPRRLLVYCGNYRLARSVVINSDQWSDDIRRSDLEPRFSYKAWRRRGADVRPLFEPAAMGTGG